MGFGHAVYRYSDPRNAVIKECALQVPNLIYIRQIQLFGQIRGLAGQELCVGQAQDPESMLNWLSIVVRRTKCPAVPRAYLFIFYGPYPLPASTLGLRSPLLPEKWVQ